MSTEPKSLADMQAEVVKVNEANGWYEREVPFPEAIALLHSEVSEALEAWRKNGLEPWFVQTWQGTEPVPDALPKPEGVGSEFADVFIRLLDYCHRYGIDLQAEYEQKLAYNGTRGYRHGGKPI